MPKNKDFKALVRARMVATGERYTQARSALAPPSPASSSPPETKALVDQLAEPGTYHQAFGLLRRLPAEILRPLAIAATGDPRWRVRRAACLLLDDLDFTTESFAALQACLEDPEPRVRRSATHSLGCQHCKPEGCMIDVRPVFERALKDRSASVRKMAVGPLTYGPDEPWRIELLRQVAADDPSGKLRAAALSALDHFEYRQMSDLERRSLPEDLRAKTERHVGKWVAVSEGRIIDAGRHSAAMERTARRHGRNDVRLYWVGPG